MNKMIRMPLLRHACAALALLLACTTDPASATDLVYTPVNPTFGGSPLNAAGLLANAQAQNRYRAPTQTPLERFNATLQQAILNRLAQQSLRTIFGSTSTLVPGTYETSGYSISVADQGNGVLKITTTDKTNGAEVSFEVSSTELAVDAGG